ncbi:MAG: hypothetical protein WBX27_13055, partial [Specibacter sp.]
MSDEVKGSATGVAATGGAGVSEGGVREAEAARGRLAGKSPSAPPARKLAVGPSRSGAQPGELRSAGGPAAGSTTG